MSQQPVELQDDDAFLYGADNTPDPDTQSDSGSDLEILTTIDPSLKPDSKTLVGMPIPRGDSTLPTPNKVDIDAVGQYDGVDIFDVDPETFADKPWRKPGADITDYFNFGFNENTWRLYCTKQKSIRDDFMGLRRQDVDYDDKRRDDRQGTKRARDEDATPDYRAQSYRERDRGSSRDRYDKSSRSRDASYERSGSRRRNDGSRDR